LIALAGQRSTLRRLQRPLYDAAAEHGAGLGCLSGGLAFSVFRGLGYQAIQLSPYRAGLATRRP
jgi:hypothetical protein